MDARQRMVRDFHLACGIPAPEHEDIAIFPAELRRSLVDEELAELTRAVEARDPVEAIDALCDLLYVAYGAAVALGSDLEPYAGPTPSVRAECSRERLFSAEALRDVQGAAQVFMQACGVPVPSGIMGATAALITAVDALAATAGVDLAPFYADVHRSNMDKTTGPKRSDGKQLKPAGWQGPKIRDILAERHPELLA